MKFNTTCIYTRFFYKEPNSLVKILLHNFNPWVAEWVANPQIGKNDFKVFDFLTL